MTAIHHFIPTLIKGDGTGNNARAMAQRITELGIESRFFVQEDKTGEGHTNYLEYPKYAKSGDILVYHLATASPIPAFLASRNEPLVVVYQNLTPPSYFSRYDTMAGTLQQRGITELELLAEKAIMGIAPSQFNAHDLQQNGYREVMKVPIIFDPGDFLGSTDPIADRSLAGVQQRGFSNWLFVGRLVPNKAQEHLIMALHAHRELYGDTAVLNLVGRPSFPGYVRSLYELAGHLRLADRVNFVMGVSPAALASFYQGSDVFISTSQHEGFCMPIVEALFHAMPVIAYDAAAVPETLGIGGIHLKEDDPVAIAQWAHEITTNQDLRRNLVQLGKARLNQIGPDSTVAQFDKALMRILSIAGANSSPDFSVPSALATTSRRFIDGLTTKADLKKSP